MFSVNIGILLIEGTGVLVTVNILCHLGGSPTWLCIRITYQKCIFRGPTPDLLIETLWE